MKPSRLYSPRSRLLRAAKESFRIVRKLVEDLDMPLSLKDVGVPEEKLSMLAELCIKDWPRPNSPRTLTKEAVLEVFQRIWTGELHCKENPQESYRPQSWRVSS